MDRTVKLLGGFALLLSLGAYASAGAADELGSFASNDGSELAVPAPSRATISPVLPGEGGGEAQAQRRPGAVTAEVHIDFSVSEVKVKTEIPNAPPGSSTAMMMSRAAVIDSIVSSDGEKADYALNNGLLKVKPLPGADGPLIMNYTVKGKEALPLMIKPGLAFLGDFGFWYPMSQAGSVSNWTIRLRLPENLVPVGNSEPVSVETKGQAREWLLDYGLVRSAPSVLAGPYKIASSSERGVTYRVASLRWNAAQTEKLADIMKRTVSFYSDNYYPYPYPALTAAELPGFGMEGRGASGLILLGDKLNVSDPASYNPVFLRHEIAHQWWGTLVSPSPADQMGYTLLAEGLAQFSSLDYLRETSPAQYKAALETVRKEYYMTAPNGEFRLADITLSAGKIPALNKGAMFFLSLSDFMGKEEFRAVLRAYASRYAWQGAPTFAEFEDIVKRRCADGAKCAEFIDKWLKCRKFTPEEDEAAGRAR